MDKFVADKYWGRVVDTMNDALLIISNQGVILSVNRSFEEMTGYTATEAVGQRCTLLECNARELIINDNRTVWCKLFEPNHEGVRRSRCEIIKKDGTRLPALKNASVLYDEDGTQLGAVETLTDISEIDRLDRKVELLTRQLDETDGYCGLVGLSDEMKKVYSIIEKAAKSDAPVIIFGESGTGKELVARAIHERGYRKEDPYVQVNCAALNESLLESELFGHVKGSFTGAFRDRKGRFETAHHGDLFLDEIGDIPLSIQIKLLRALECQRFEHVGDNRSISVDVRIITATNKNLIELISQNKFRQDLYFRINVLPIHLPPLRQRREDIPLLVETFMDRLNKKTRKNILGVQPRVMNALLEYHWPGNVRELKSILHYAFTIAESGPINCDHLPPRFMGRVGLDVERHSLLGVKDAKEKQSLLVALKKTGGNQTRAAKILGVNRVTVWNRMRKYGIDIKRDVVS
ncbi:MAG: sigma 54-interacting transcriptional regulator [Desulfobacteraceae bacterium]|jgi:PAS domain S-box-containing protein